MAILWKDNISNGSQNQDATYLRAYYMLEATYIYVYSVLGQKHKPCLEYLTDRVYTVGQKIDLFPWSMATFFHG